MLGQFFNMLYSIVDRIFVGQIPETGGTALASIGICAPALTAVTAFAYMVGIGGASSMSISLGQKDQKRANTVLGNAVLLLLGLSLFLTVVLLLVRRPLLYLLGCSETMYPYTNTYFTIYICGTVASLCGVGLNQFLLAQGYSKQGMLSVVIGAAVNVILDPLLIFVFHMGIAGAAAATVISQCCMAVYVVWQLRSPKMPIRLRFCRLKRELCQRILSIGSMSFLITLLDNLIIILLNVILRKYGGISRGDQLITCATVVQSFMTIVSCPAQGITSGCGTIYSYHYGAGHYKKIRQAFIGVFALCGAYIGFLWIGVQVFPQLFTGLFLQDSSLNLQASASLRMYTMALIGVAVQYALVDGLTAMGKVRFAFPLSVFRKIVYVICIFVIPLIADVSFVFLAGTISDAIGAIFSAILFFSVIIPKLKNELLPAGQLLK
ncbi:MAG: MATE family efflux transporter [Oscillospiraceae bacterium]|nr:MATE family efflux transporter [Oscillospiraceae bacterium]